MANNAVILKGHGIRREAVANAAITPGHLVELMSTSKVRVHATASGNAIPMFAVEDDLQGNDISDAYAAADQVQYNVMQPGDEVYALLANGQNIAVGDFLESAGDGTLQKYVADTWASAGAGTIYPRAIVALALEAVDMSDSSAADPTGRIKVMVV